VKRRDFITLIGATTAWSFEACALPAGEIRLVGVPQDLARNEPIAQSEVVAFRETLANLGWTEGRNPSSWPIRSVPGPLKASRTRVATCQQEV
jgi:hypothetical protein